MKKDLKRSIWQGENKQLRGKCCKVENLLKKNLEKSIWQREKQQLFVKMLQGGKSYE